MIIADSDDHDVKEKRLYWASGEGRRELLDGLVLFG